MSQQRRYSFEFFPTKTDAGHDKLMAVARELAGYNPDFFSCTYGAGGSTRDRTLNTILQLDAEVGVLPRLFFEGILESLQGVCASTF